MALLGDFIARVGNASEINDVIGTFSEEISNNNGEKLVSSLTEVDLNYFTGSSVLNSIISFFVCEHCHP